MAIKYEPVFGDQNLFDNAPEETVCVERFVSPNLVCAYTRYHTIAGLLNTLIERNAVSCASDRPDIAIRRVVKTPTWTRADQEAGLRPPVGAKYLAGSDNRELECLYVDAAGTVWGFSLEGAVLGYALCYCGAIETPEEKAARLRREWVAKAFILASSESYVMELQTIYDALLSGELKAPTND